MLAVVSFNPLQLPATGYLLLTLVSSLSLCRFSLSLSTQYSVQYSEEVKEVLTRYDTGASGALPPLWPCGTLLAAAAARRFRCPVLLSFHYLVAGYYKVAPLLRIFISLFRASVGTGHGWAGRSRKRSLRCSRYLFHS